MRSSDRGFPFPYNARRDAGVTQFDNGRRRDQFSRHEERHREVQNLTGFFNEVLGDRKSTPPNTLASMSGPAGVTRYCEELQRRATTQIRQLDCVPPDSRGTRLPDFTRTSHNEGVRYRYICGNDPAARHSEIKEWREQLPPSVQVRLLPDAPCKIVIADSLGAVLVSSQIVDRGGSDNALMVHPSPLLDVIISMFETLWELSSPLADPTASAEQLTTDEREIICLLADGITEEAIARRLDVSLRTVQRRIQSLMSRLNATNRFQAGINAANRNWI